MSSPTIPFHIERLELTNFRCFDSFKLDFHPQLTVLVAENGGGKTSVLEGLSIALGELVNDLTSVDQRLRSGVGFKDKDFRLRVATGRNGRDVSVPADFVQAIISCRLDERSFRWDTWKPRRPDVKPLEAVGGRELKELVSAVLARADARYLITESIEGEIKPSYLPTLAYYGFNKAEFKIPKRYRSGQYNYGAALSAYIGCLRSGGDMKEFLNWFDEAESDVLRMLRDSKEGEALEMNMPLLAVRNAIAEIFSESDRRFANPRFEANPKRFCLDEILPGNHRLTLEFTQLSDGYNRVLTLVMDHARRLGLANQYTDMSPLACPGVVLIDEIDIHLHPSWQQRVIGDLLRTFPNTQFIVTTHSPQVLSTVKRESIRILAQDADGIWSADMPKEETKGVESSSALNDVMGVNQVPPVPEARWRNDYTALIENDTHESAEGRDLRDKLVALYGAQHPIILDFDRLIRFQAFKTKQAKRD